MQHFILEYIIYVNTENPGNSVILVQSSNVSVLEIHTILSYKRVPKGT